MALEREKEPAPQTARWPSYRDYLQSPTWRKRRDRALRRVSWQCERCAGVRELQVHHKSYARLGAELDEDLEVLCRGCHLGHHAVKAQDAIRLYVKLVSDAINSGKYSNITDLVDGVKSDCVRLKLPTNNHEIDAALHVVDARLPVTLPKRVAELYQRAPADEGASRAEAAAVLSRLGLAPLMKHMPEVEFITQHEADRRRAMQMVTDEMLESIRRCEELEKAIR